MVYILFKYLAGFVKNEASSAYYIGYVFYLFITDMEYYTTKKKWICIG